MGSNYPVLVTTDSTADFLYDMFYIDASSNDVTLTLPDMTGMGDGTVVTIERRDGSTFNSYVEPTNTTFANPPLGSTSTQLVLGLNTIYCLNYFSNEWYIIGYDTGSTAQPVLLLTGNTQGADIKVGTLDNYSISVHTNNTERLKIDSTGEITFDSSSIKLANISAGNTGYIIKGPSGTLGLVRQYRGVATTDGSGVWSITNPFGATATIVIPKAVSPNNTTITDQYSETVSTNNPTTISGTVFNGSTFISGATVYVMAEYLE